MTDYETFSKQYSLPALSDIDPLFDFSSIEEKPYLRQARKKIAEKFEAIAGNIQDIINPESTPVSMTESGFFSDAQKEELYVLFKKLMYQVRISTALSIEDSDALNAQYIKEAFEFWKAHSVQIKQIFSVLRDSWKKDLNKEVRAHYLG